MSLKSDAPAQASPLRSKLRPLGEFAWQRARGNWQNWLVVAALVVLFLFAHRFLDGLDVGGDAVSKWQFVRQWSYANDFSAAKWDHHMTRFGVNGITWLVQKTFSTNWRSYYIAPVFMAALQVPLVYALSRRLAGNLAGLFAALCITYLPAVHTSLSQLLPDGFVGTYGLLATYLLIRLVDARQQARLPLLLGLGVVAFVGYLAKETFFFFYPGLGVALLLARRSLRDGVIFAGILLLGLALETGWYRLFTTYPSRLAIVRSVHFAWADDDEPTVATASGFVKMFTGLDRDWHYLLLAAAVGAVWLLVFNRSQKTQGRIVVLVGASYLLLLGFSTQFWQRPLPRYMIPVAPFAAVCAGVAAAMLVVALARVLSQVPGSVGATLRGAGSFVSQKSVVTAGVVLVVVLAGIRTYRQQLETPPFDGLEHGALMARLANRTYARNLPIVQGKRAKVLTAFYDVYLHDKQLARGGILPDFSAAKRRHGSYTYIVKDPSVYNRQVFANLLDAECVLDVRRGSKRLGMGGCADTSRYTELPERCDALLAELTGPAK